MEGRWCVVSEWAEEINLIRSIKWKREEMKEIRDDLVDGRNSFGLSCKWNSFEMVVGQTKCKFLVELKRHQTADDGFERRRSALKQIKNIFRTSVGLPAAGTSGLSFGRSTRTRIRNNKFFIKLIYFLNYSDLPIEFLKNSVHSGWLSTLSID